LAGRTDWEQAAGKRDAGDGERSLATPGYLAWSKEWAGSAKKAGVSYNTARKYLRQLDPSKQEKQPHDWRTRKDPLEVVAEFAMDALGTQPHLQATCNEGFVISTQAFARRC